MVFVKLFPIPHIGKRYAGDEVTTTVDISTQVNKH